MNDTLFSLTIARTSGTRFIESLWDVIKSICTMKKQVSGAFWVEIKPFRNFSKQARKAFPSATR